MAEQLKNRHSFCTFRNKFQDNMSRSLLLMFFALSGVSAFAQNTDSLFAVRKAKDSRSRCTWGSDEPYAEMFKF